MMNSEEFKKAGEEIIDYIADYRDTISERRVIPKEKPSFLKKHVPLKAPENAEKWENLMKDVDKYIIPGLTHWIHPHFYGYLPMGCSLASALGTCLAGSFGCFGNFACPASTELEIIVSEWLARSFDLPKKFLFYEEGSKSVCSLNGSASECSLLALMAAQNVALEKLKKESPSIPDGELLSSLVAYCSKEAHSSVEKACLIAMVTLRILDTDDKFTFRGEQLEKAVEEDLKDGLHPFFVIGTIGTTSTGSADKFDELGPICKKYSLWLHVDGAYGMATLICPEFRHLASGFEYASSVSTNPYKWLLMTLECSLLWVADRYQFMKALSSSSIIPDTDGKIINFSHWETTNRRRFIALKMWMVIRKYGIQGMRAHIRNHVRLAKKIKAIISQDERFEVLDNVTMGVVCFRLKSSNEDNSKLLAAIVETGKIFMIPCSLGNAYYIRFSMNCENLTEKDLLDAWEVIEGVLEDLEKS